MNFDSGRIVLEAGSAPPTGADFEVAALGHTGAAADLAVLFSNTRLIAELEELGYIQILAALRARWQQGVLVDDLFNLPLPIRSLAEYQALFSHPPVTPEAQPYHSLMAGAQKWLPRAVRDFFIDPGEVNKKLWLIPVNPGEGQSAFYPDSHLNLLDLASADAFSRALALPGLALIILPDYERLQVPSNLENIPRLRLDNPAPTFLPCSTNMDDGIRERASFTPNLNYPDPEPFSAAVHRMLSALKRFRPDVRLMLTMPFDQSLNGELPQISAAAVTELNQLKQSRFNASLHRLQLIYPYLRDANQQLGSATALLAGQIASRAVKAGPWRSIAGQNLPGDYQPWPNLSQAQIARLRDEVGIGVLKRRLNAMQLDDERLSAGVFSTTDNAHGQDASGEISRFLGWLYRSLENLGMALVFDDQRGNRQGLIYLNDFFNRLYQLGALRGRTPEQAYRIEQSIDGDGEQVIFSIAIAPAFPIDTIRISLQQDRVEFANV
jgi:hypothetical protein